MTFFSDELSLIGVFGGDLTGIQIYQSNAQQSNGDHMAPPKKAPLTPELAFSTDFTVSKGSICHLDVDSSAKILSYCL